MLAVEALNISKSFKKTKALDNISFNVNKGEIFGIIGPDGAGKTSLFRILVSLLVPDQGSVTVLGHDVVKDFREIRRKTGYMAGRFSLYQDLTVEENLNFYSTVYGTGLDMDNDLFKYIYFSLEPFKKRLAGKLSGGMKQKLALSCALIHRPELLILDEPTTGVDVVSRKGFWDLLKHINKEGITVIVSTPYMDEARLCDRVGLMQKGLFLSISRPSEIHKAFNKILYEVSHPMGSYQLVLNLRKFHWCSNAWMFGQKVHLSIDSEEKESQFKSHADANNLIYTRIRASIEDTFMELMKY